jgi:hypothetical protein
LSVQGEPRSPRWLLVPLFSPGDLRDKLIDRAEVERVLARAPCTIALAQPGSAEPTVHSEVRDVLRERGGEPVAAWPPESGKTPESSKAVDGRSPVATTWIGQLLSQRAWGPAIEAYRLPGR